MQIVTPYKYIPLTPLTIPVFLAGPVLGGGDWQKDVIEEFIKLSKVRWTIPQREEIFPRVSFIVPCRWGNDSLFARRFAKTFESVYEEDTTRHRIETSQTAWENFYLNYIVKGGVGLLAFGLFSQRKPREDGSPYARDTYGEVGRWTEISRYEDTKNIIIAADESFPGIDVIWKNLIINHGEEKVGSMFRNGSWPTRLAEWISDYLTHHY